MPPRCTPPGTATHTDPAKVRSTAFVVAVAAVAIAGGLTTIHPLPSAAATVHAGDPPPPPPPIPFNVTYQGRLDIAGVPAEGTVDLRFQLFDAPTSGSSVGDAIDRTDVPVFGGVFSTTLDFSPSFFEDSRWLQVSVLESGGTVSPLLPRQPITSAPTALGTRGVVLDETGTRVGIGGAPIPGLPTPLTVHGDEGPDAALALALVNANRRWNMGPNSAGDLLMAPGDDAPIVSIDPDGNIDFPSGVQMRGVASIIGSPTSGLGISGSPASSINGPEIHLDSAGNIGFGTTSPQSRFHFVHPAIGSSWGIRLANAFVGNFQGGMRLSDDGFFDVTNTAGSGNPTYARLNSGGVWTAISDARTKTDIVPLSGGLADAMRLQPVTYHYRDANGAPAGPRRIGFIAQQVQDVVPSLVTDGDDVMTLDYATLSTIAIAALREQQAELDRSREALDALRATAHERRAHVASLEAALEHLESRLAPQG